MEKFFRELFSYPVSPVKLWAMILSELPTFFALLLLGAAIAFFFTGNAEQRIWYLGTGFLLIICGRIIVITALAAVGFRAKGPGGISVDIDAAGSAAPVVVTTTKTSVEPPK